MIVCILCFGFFCLFFVVTQNLESNFPLFVFSCELCSRLLNDRLTVGASTLVIRKRALQCADHLQAIRQHARAGLLRASLLTGSLSGCCAALRPQLQNDTQVFEPGALTLSQAVPHTCCLPARRWLCHVHSAGIHPDVDRFAVFGSVAHLLLYFVQYLQHPICQYRARSPPNVRGSL